MDPKYPLVEDAFHGFALEKYEDFKEEVINFDNHAAFHEEKIYENAIHTMHAFQRLPPMPHNMSIIRSPPHHFLTPEAPNYYNLMSKPNVIHQNFVQTDEYQFPLPPQQPQKIANWPPMNRHKLEPLDLRPIGEEVQNIGQQNFPQNVKIVDNKPKMNQNSTLNEAGLPIDDKLLLHISIPELNQHLKPFPPSEKDKLKKKRRQLKNRKYAEDCRIRRKVRVTELETRNRKLESQINTLVDDYTRALREVEHWKNKYQLMVAKFSQVGTKVHTTNEYL